MPSPQRLGEETEGEGGVRRRPVKEIGPGPQASPGKKFPPVSSPIDSLLGGVLSKHEPLPHLRRLVHPKTEKALKHTERFRKHARQWGELHEEARLQIATLRRRRAASLPPLLLR